ncbi:hypothetical protein BLNAU_25023 [Blattamonas nauphoetae]|uniref:Uncharacterized protein n=1 Tax=Blattamonas nauphoetae TaxID=2049346 RepID=A0ABQ9WKT6_9EUKA|nr:hypothetical protein BLNAU_25023 [Blattamonas nauphoetae]
MDDPNGRFADFVTASYLYTYGVYSLKEGATKPGTTKNVEQVYEHPDAQNIPEDASSSTEWEHLGMSLSQQSNLNRGSKLAPGSALMLHLICNKKELTEDLNVNEQMILLSGSTVAKDSKIVEYPANTLSLFRDDDGTEIRMSTQPQRTHYGQQETINRDYVLEAGSTLRKGIAPGSVIKKDSILGAGSSIATLKVENLLKGQHWHVVDDIMFSEQTPMYRDQNYVLFTSPKGSRWEEVNNNQKRNGTYLIEYSVPKYPPKEQAALLNTMGAQTEILNTKEEQPAIENTKEEQPAIQNTKEEQPAIQNTKEEQPAIQNTKEEQDILNRKEDLTDLLALEDPTDLIGLEDPTDLIGQVDAQPALLKAMGTPTVVSEEDITHIKKSVELFRLFHALS